MRSQMMLVIDSNRVLATAAMRNLVNDQNLFPLLAEVVCVHHDCCVHASPKALLFHDICPVLDHSSQTNSLIQCTNFFVNTQICTNWQRSSQPTCHLIPPYAYMRRL